MLQILSTLDDLGDTSLAHRPNMCKCLVGSKMETQDFSNSYSGIERFFNRKGLPKKQFFKGTYQIILWQEQSLTGTCVKFPSQDPYR